MPIIQEFGGVIGSSGLADVPGLVAGYTTAPSSLHYNAKGQVIEVFETWNSGVTYRNNDFSVGSDSLIYISQQAGNIGHDPISDDGTYWKLLRTYVLEALTAGNGLSKSGNTVDVNVDGSTLEINADSLRMKDGGTTFAKLASSAQPGFYVDLLSGSTPSATGADTFEFVVPPAPDGSSATFTFVKVVFRVLNAGTSGNPGAKLQKGTAGAGAFGTGTDVHTALTITGNQSTTLEASTTSFSSTTCQTGDKLRVNVTALGTSSANWMFSVFARRTA